MLLDAVKKIQQVYHRCSFEIINLLMDGQFEPICGDVASLGITLNTVVNDEHVPEVEQYIHTLKEWTQAIYNTLPFKQMPSHIIIEMVYAANLWFNMFPHPNSISQTMSPRTILTSPCIKYTTHCQLEFGSMYRHTRNMTTLCNHRPLGPSAYVLPGMCKVATSSSASPQDVCSTVTTGHDFPCLVK